MAAYSIVDHVTSNDELFSRCGFCRMVVGGGVENWLPIPSPTMVRACFGGTTFSGTHL